MRRRLKPISSLFCKLVIDFFAISTLSFPPTMMHGNRVAPLTNATNATANANFDALPSYESYDLAWLG